MAVEASYTSWREDDADPFARVAPDLVCARYVELSVTNERDLPLELAIDVEYDPELERYAAVRVEIVRQHEGQEITLAALQSLRIRSFLQEGLHRTMWIGSHNGEQFSLGASDEQAALMTARGPRDPETSLWVARIYAAARVLNLPPAKTVQTELRLTAPTASVWIRRARAFNLLDVWGTEIGDHHPQTIADFATAWLHEGGSDGQH